MRCIAVGVLLALVGCTSKPRELDPRIYAFANGCYVVASPGKDGALLRLHRNAITDALFSEVATEAATPWLMRPSRLGTYLLFDDQENFLVVRDGQLGITPDPSAGQFPSDYKTYSDAEWELRSWGKEHFRLRHVVSGLYLGRGGMEEKKGDAARLLFENGTACAQFPEEPLYSSGAVESRGFTDGSVYGIADTHSHIFTNLGFGGGSVFHGAPFHPLGIRHALPDCAPFHGEEGRKDLFGYVFDNGAFEADLLVTALLLQMAPESNHATAGYPEFTDWPNADRRATHQTQYYRWLERAYRAGLRLVVQHATSNRVICDVMTGQDLQPVAYDCSDMTAVDASIDAAFALESYIDAQSGGPGLGWLRIARSPAEAREIIEGGKLAMVLGIEVSDLFDCPLVPDPGAPPCTEASVSEKLDGYFARGVRVMFPVHKYDNAFSAGDGQKAFGEVGNFVRTGHFSNFTEDCPDIPSTFDRGALSFPGLNMPRDDYGVVPPNDMSGFAEKPLDTLLPFLPYFEEPPLAGDFCQNSGLTALGEHLLLGMMARGMVIELDHLPRRSYVRAMELLTENDYPAAGTHGRNAEGALYELGGVSKSSFGTCHDPSQPATVDDGYQARIQLIGDRGGYPAEGLGLDLNGFAGARGPRFGADSVCTAPQANPVTYPFRSYAGDVEFVAPQIGNRPLDFNTEGLIHIGLLPELIEDVRRDGVTDEALEPLFRSAEAYLRMWEKAERRAQEMR